MGNFFSGDLRGHLTGQHGRSLFQSLGRSQDVQGFVRGPRLQDDQQRSSGLGYVSDRKGIQDRVDRCQQSGINDHLNLREKLFVTMFAMSPSEPGIVLSAFSPACLQAWVNPIVLAYLSDQFAHFFQVFDL